MPDGAVFCSYLIVSIDPRPTGATGTVTLCVAEFSGIRVRWNLDRYLQSTRCIIPADGFYEWRKEGRRKVPMWVHLKNKEPFAFAGLWDVWRKPDGKRVESFTIVTTEPNELVRPIHNRMPVILRPDDEKQWLDVSRTSFAKAQSVLQPYPEELMDAHDVSPVVNSVKYDGPECIKPVSGDERTRARQLSLL